MSTFLTSLTLTAADFKRLKITDAYSLHRVVYGLFEKSSSDTSIENRILYSDLGGDFSRRRVEILSERAPNTDHLSDAIKVRELTDHFFNHVSYNFQVTINPVRRKGSVAKAITDRSDIVSWFSDKSNQWGFEVSPQHIEVNSVGPIIFEAKDKQPVTLNQAHLRGTLRVTDRRRFIHSAKNGIGRGKSFGCGLLLLIPAS